MFGSAVEDVESSPLKSHPQSGSDVFSYRSVQQYIVCGLCRGRDLLMSAGLIHRLCKLNLVQCYHLGAIEGSWGCRREDRKSGTRSDGQQVIYIDWSHLGLGSSRVARVVFCSAVPLWA